MQFHYVRRVKNGEDLGVIDIPTQDLAETLKRNKEWVDLGEVSISKVEVPEIKIGVTECPICGFIAKNATGLQVHKKKHYLNA